MIQYDDVWIRENYRGVCDKSFLDAYNQHTGQMLKKDTLRHHIMRKMELTSDFTYTEEQLSYILSHYSKWGMKKTAKMFNKKFGTNKSPESICRVAVYKDVHVPSEVARKNSYSSPDAVGTIREEPSTGYLVIKTGDSWKDWMKYQRYVYEQAYGKLPEDYSVVFLDGNNRNFDLSNLVAVPRKYVVYMNSNKLRSENPEITKTSIMWCELYDALKGEIKNVRRKENL